MKSAFDRTAVAKYALVLVAALAACGARAGLDWTGALDGAQRSEANRARDTFRHPRQTLEFFGLEPGMTVVEIAPGGGWYTEVLAPLLRGNGTLYAAHYSLNPPNAYYRNSLGRFLQKLAADSELYDGVVVTQLQPPAQALAAPAGSADLALAFRSVHSWMRADTLAPTLGAIYAALKPGGRFGLVQHRAQPGTSVADMKRTGYVTEAYVIAAAEKAGFELVERADINANPKDSADHPKGVWNLPPALRDGGKRRDHYLAIGESDRMTLLFAKPAP
ncbi:class I SAM-dependent methyltransferase [Parahaliea mediterranea]|uniref:Class I SAM-dependent methyltransferase n=1 Tax=Parahaliea mediterranea TaxID=651086 RepID=A0A939DIN7_9GAMM|nr:class I SAM-dependent methyltransferase [Parahaliea mediterranea]MBN7798861.1 class I SAM-dependent methyltransferase [Parahaliea mediterranea]